MTRSHPALSELAQLTTDQMLDMVRTGMMDGRDSEGGLIKVPLSAAMYARIIDWLKYHQVTMDASPDSGSSVAQIAEALRAKGVAGKLPPDDPEEDAA